MKESIAKDDLVFHSVHGLCRVASVTSSAQAQPKEVNYSLLPVSANKGKVRFIIPESSLEMSGFSKLISVREAHAILDYFKTGEKKDSARSQAWTLAETVWSESVNEETVKDKKKRQVLERSVNALVGELAYVLKSTLKETAERIQRNLGVISKINPLVLAVLGNVEDN